MHLNSKIDFSKFAFIFDHDGVLADNEKLHKQAWFKVLEMNSLNISDKEYIKEVKGFSTKDAVGNLFPELSSNQQERIRSEKAMTYDGMVKKSLKPISGVIGFVKASKKIGIKTCIASAALRKRIDFSIVKFGLENDIDKILSSEDVAKTKPDPEVYLKAIKYLNVNPENAFIFEDSPNGLIAANLSGANAIFVNSSNLKENEVNQKYLFEIKNFDNLDPEFFINKR